MQSLVENKAPNFVADFVLENNTIKERVSFYDYIGDKMSVLFFYPLDFTFVCPSEIIAIHNKISEFQKRNTLILGVSVDSAFSHLAYRNVPTDKGGIGEIKFPLISDINKEIAKSYGVLSKGGVALRGVFIINSQKTIMHQLVNALPIGRSIDEILRTVDAIQFNEKHGEVCPANWKSGRKAMVPTSQGVKEYLKINAQDL